jgi:thioredoxin-like negative regulator of GroEL
MDYIKLNEELENIKEKNSMAIVYFGSKMCGVCTALKPKIEEMLKSYPNIKSVQVDADISPEMAAANNIFTIPGILLFIDGKEAIREARFISVPDIENKISRYYEMYFDC